VPAGDESGGCQTNNPILADDDAVDVDLDPPEELGGALRRKCVVGRCRHGNQSRTGLRSRLI